MMHRARARSGSLGPALMIALALLFLLGLLAIAQMQLSSQSLHVAAWDAGGAIAENVAVSAIEEAAWRLNILFSDSRATEFKELRLAIVGKTPKTLDLTRQLYPAQLEKKLATATDRPLYRATRLDRFSAVLSVPPRQYVDFDATVTISVSGHTIYRRVVERRLYGATFVSPRKPWDRTTLAIKRHSGVPALGTKVERLHTALEDANRMIEFANSIIPLPGSCSPDCGPELPAAVFGSPFVRFGKAPDLPDGLRSKVDRLVQSDPSLQQELSTLDPDELSWRLWSLAQQPAGKAIPVPAARCCTQPQLPRLEPVQPRLVYRKVPSTARITSTTEKLDLSRFDYEVRLRDEYQPDAKRIEEVVVPLNQRLSQWMANPPASESDRATLASTLYAAAQQMPALFKTASKSLNKITRHAQAHSRLKIPDEAMERPMGLIPMAYHTEKQAHFDEFRKAYSSFSGHLAHVGPGPLVVTLPRFSGVSILTQQYGRPKPLTLREIRLQRPTHDLLVVHSDVIRISDSEIHAGLHVATLNSRLFLDNKEPRIKGNLVMEVLQTLGSRTPEEELKGRIEYNPALASGGAREGSSDPKLPEKMPAVGTTAWKRIAPALIALDHIALALRPRGRDRAVFRSPGAFEDAKKGGKP